MMVVGRTARIGPVSCLPAGKDKGQDSKKEKRPLGQGSL